MAMSNDALGERIRALEVLQVESARRQAEDRERAAVDRREMREQIEEVRDDVKGVRTDVSAIQSTIQSYADQTAGALKMGAAFKALAVITGTGLLAIMGFLMTYGAKIATLLQSTPPPR